MRRWLLGIMLCSGMWSVPACAQTGGVPRDEIRETFDDGGWDRHWWTVDMQSPPGVRVDAADQALRIVIPAGAADRPPARMQGRFHLEGDFDVQVSYRLRGFPEPGAGWLNAQLLIDGPGGPAAVIRTNHAELGPGYALWSEPTAEGVPDVWRQVPTRSRDGILRLERTGEELRFLYSDAETAREFSEIGSVRYGEDPITSIELWVMVPETSVAVDLSFDDVAARAERIVDPHASPASPAAQRSWAGWLAGGSFLLLAAATGWTLWSRRR